MSPVHVDMAWILQAVESSDPRDPAVDDFGVALAAAERHRGTALGRPLYDGPYARAAALAHQLGRCRWLEHSNIRAAYAVAVGYLHASEVLVRPGKEDMQRFAAHLRDERCTAHSLARELRTWPTG